MISNLLTTSTGSTIGKITSVSEKWTLEHNTAQPQLAAETDNGIGMSYLSVY